MAWMCFNLLHCPIKFHCRHLKIKFSSFTALVLCLNSTLALGYEIKIKRFCPSTVFQQNSVVSLFGDFVK